MRSHSRAIHSSKAIPRIIRNRGMDSSRAIHPKVEGIKDILSRDTLNKDIPNKLIPNKLIPNKLIRNKVILNKDTPNSKTISNRAMDNHLPVMLRPKKRRP